MLWSPEPPSAGPILSPAARRTLVALGAIGAGFLIGRNAPGTFPGVMLSLACACCALALLVRGASCRVLLLGGVVLLGAGWFQLRIREVPGNSVALLVPADDGLSRTTLVEVEGTVVRPPAPAPPGQGSMARFFPSEPALRFEMAIDHVRVAGRMVRASGLARIRVAGSATLDLRAGQRVRVTGELTPVARPLNPGVPDRRLWAAQENRVGTISVPSAALVEPAQSPAGPLASVTSTWVSARQWLRDRAASVFDGAGSPNVGRDVMRALILGEIEPGLRETQSAFTRVGLAHVLAISGFHLLVMAQGALLVVRLTGDRGWWESAIVGSLVLGYLLIVPAEAPVVRSAVMVLALLAADFAGRRYDPVAILAWAAILLLLVRPMDLWSLGFQLSFGLTGVMIAVGPRFQQRLFPPALVPPQGWRRALGPVGAWARSLVAISVLCWLVSAPLLVVRTGLISPLAVLATLVATPIAIGALWLGYLALAIGMLVPALGAPAGDLVGAIGDVAAAFVGWLDALPGSSVRLPAVSWAWGVGATLVVLRWLVVGRVRDAGAWLATSLAVAWLLAELAVGGRPARDVVLRIDTLAVGDGTCHVIRAGEDALLWDCGSLWSGIGVDELPRAMRAIGVRRVPVAVVSHANLDHYSALPDLAPRIGLRRVLVGAAFVDAAAANPDGPVACLIRELNRRGIEIEAVGAGDGLPLRSVRGGFIWPPLNTAQPTLNDSSLVAVLDVPTDGGARRVMLCGDIQRAAMAGLLTAHAEAGLRADVLELPHHGSPHDVAFAFVSHVAPGVVLQSTGPGRAGDPRWASARAGRRWHTTATDGASWVEILRDGTVRSGSLY